MLGFTFVDSFGMEIERGWLFDIVNRLLRFFLRNILLKDSVDF